MTGTTPDTPSPTIAMEGAIKRAKVHGSSLVGVYNTSHCGMAGYYADMARKEDLVALLFADCLPRITTFGGSEPILGTNPLAVSIPSNSTPILFDMSTASIGFGLGLIIQILAGVLVNAATIPPPGVNDGLLMIAIDPSIFVPIDLFKREVDVLLDCLKATRREAGVEEIAIPGERAYREREQRLETGIDLEDNLLAQRDRCI